MFKLLAKVSRPTVFIISGSVLFSSTATASGALNPYQSESSATVATAGTTASAEDASTIYYNPAGITELRRPEIIWAGGLVFMDDSFSNGGTTNAAGGLVKGNSKTNQYPEIQPAVFFSIPVNDRLSLGLGAFSPFGQSTIYDNDWVGRYQVQKTSLLTLDVRPVGAYRVTDWLSVGAGIDIQYVRFKRASAIDFGSICTTVVGPAPCSSIGLTPENADGRVTTRLHDWTTGYALGFLIKPTPDLRVGVNYRSAAHNDLTGKVDFTVPAPARLFTLGGAFQDTTDNATLNFPQIVSAGAAYEITPKITGLLDVTWAQWSELQDLSLSFGNATPPQRQRVGWQDTWKVAIGGIYHWSEGTDLRAGIAYDESAITDQYRTADLPQADTIEIGIGIAQRLTDAIQVIAGYNYSHEMTAPIDLTMPNSGTLVGRVRQNSHAIGAQLKYQF